MRVCVLTNILPPYRIAFYNELAELCDLHVVFDTLLTPDRKWQVDHSEVRFAHTIADNWRKAILHNGTHFSGERRYFEFANHTLPLLRSLQPDIVVSLELGARTVQAALYCAVTQKPLICFWEGTSHTEARISWWRRLLRPRLASACDAFWVNGKASADYARSLGVANDCIYEGMTGVDTFSFATRAQAARSQRDERRRVFGLRGVTFIFSGALSARKGIRELLVAADKVAKQRREHDFSFLFVGEGELRPEIEVWAKTHPAVPVHLTGFINSDELADHYVCGDWAILPTLEDCFPLATLEPIACGLPQILSIYNGATADLLSHPGIGLAADPLDADAFAAVINSAIDLGTAPLGQDISSAVVNYYSPQQQAQRGHKSLVDVLKRSRRGVDKLCL